MSRMGIPRVEAMPSSNPRVNAVSGSARGTWGGWLRRASGEANRRASCSQVCARVSATEVSTP